MLLHVESEKEKIRESDSMDSSNCTGKKFSRKIFWAAGPVSTGTQEKFTELPGFPGTMEGVPDFINREIRKIPGKTRRAIDHLTGWQKHLSGRLRKKMTGFDYRIATFPQRKWS
jgi:hypothetical protein